MINTVTLLKTFKGTKFLLCTMQTQGSFVREQSLWKVSGKSKVSCKGAKFLLLTMCINTVLSCLKSKGHGCNCSDTLDLGVIPL